MGLTKLRFAQEEYGFLHRTGKWGKKTEIQDFTSSRAKELHIASSKDYWKTEQKDPWRKDLLRSTKTAIASGNSALLYCSNFCMVCSIRQNVEFHSSGFSPQRSRRPGIRTTGNSPIECGATPSAVASVDVEKVRVPFIMTVDYLPTISGFWQHL